MKGTVTFFSTCLVEHVYPDAGIDSVALLELCGYQVQLPAYQSCCAQPAYNSGAFNDAVAVAKTTIDLLSDNNNPVIVPSAACADMIINHYPSLLSDNERFKAKALALSDRCFELIGFISDDLPSIEKQRFDALRHEPVSPASSKIMLHNSCSARRGTKTSSTWRSSLEKSGINVCEPNYAEECCGFGGTFAVKSPEISSVMADDKCKHLGDSHNHFSSGDCGCLMHLNGYAEKQGLLIRGEHIATTLARQYGIACGDNHDK